MKHFFKKHRSLFKLIEETPAKPGFRNCQLGAIWATKSHFTASENHALITMPTGTGKTGIMIALAFEYAVDRVFVLAPTVLIREQTAAKFESLRLLKKIGALPSKLADGPDVKEVTSRPTSAAEWRKLLQYDVVVATPHTVSPAFAAEPPADFFAAVGGNGGGRERQPKFGLVFVDEAHHSSAPTWSSFLDLVTGTKVVYVTATPFRRDRRRIKARPIYSYSISKAMADGIYREVRLERVEDAREDRLDPLLAGRALYLFQEEREVNPDATVIVKARSIARAEELMTVYRQEGWERLGIIHSDKSPEHNLEVIKRVRRERGVARGDWLDGFISVDMAGEGIDIPNLKIAGICLPLSLRLRRGGAADKRCTALPQAQARRRG